MFCFLFHIAFLQAVGLPWSMFHFIQCNMLQYLLSFFSYTMNFEFIFCETWWNNVAIGFWDKNHSFSYIVKIKMVLASLWSPIFFNEGSENDTLWVSASVSFTSTKKPPRLIHSWNDSHSTKSLHASTQSYR